MSGIPAECTDVRQRNNRRDRIMTNDIPNPIDDRRSGCAVCGLNNCEGACPISEHRTFLLKCDLCGDQTRVLTEDKYAPRFLDDWKQEHDVHHVYIDPPGKHGPPVVDALDAPIQLCRIPSSWRCGVQTGRRLRLVTG